MIKEGVFTWVLPCVLIHILHRTYGKLFMTHIVSVVLFGTE